MVRPRIPRKLRFNPKALYLKPQGVPLRTLDEVVITHDEVEALKLYHTDKLEQKEAAKEMQISQPTFSRTLDSVYNKLSDAIIEGKAIKIEKEQ